MERVYTVVWLLAILSLGTAQAGYIHPAMLALIWGAVAIAGGIVLAVRRGAEDRPEHRPAAGETERRAA